MADERKQEEKEIKIPDRLPVLPLRDVVIFPMMLAPLIISRERSVSAVDKALAKDRMLLLVTQKKGELEEPTPEDLYRMGTAAVIVRMLKLPDGKVRALVQGVSRVRIVRFEEEASYLMARVEKVIDLPFDRSSPEVEALLRAVKANLEKAVSLGKEIPPEVLIVASNLDDPGKLADIAVFNLELKPAEAEQILEELDPVARLTKLNKTLLKEIDILTVQQEITAQARDKMDKAQREYLLRQQLKEIQKELGEGDEIAEDLKLFRERMKEKNIPQDVVEEINKQIERLRRMHPDSAETASLRNYLDTVTSLPWGVKTKDNLDIKRARKILDEDHYNLDKVKERILEHLSVMKLKKDEKLHGSILCFVGPPGVGKTSLGKSIARAMGRKFVRISLGGVRDEAEIRGHRRTYVGALPGKIVQGIARAGTSNPVFMMDEVDKLGADYRGDPAAALLEVLDPEQNHSFSDNYLGVSYNLSDVMFILTANLLDPIHPAFLDRMEVLFLPGYTEEEKIKIAEKFLIPRQIRENGLKPGDIKLSESALRVIIRCYTREAGVRNLEREIASICRKAARKIAEGEKAPFLITRAYLDSYLGPPKIFPELALTEDRVGVATGLAWTAHGGEVLFIEATVMKGKRTLILTGHLGEIMKESAQAALSYIRSYAPELGIDHDSFENHDYHIHIPEGATPKDGPSAGVAIVTALASAFTGKPVRRDVAMTGEITLTGNVLPIGGVKEKVLAASRAGIRNIVLPKANEKDLSEIPKKLRKKLNFIFATEIKQALASALSLKPAVVQTK